MDHVSATIRLLEEKIFQLEHAKKTLLDLDVPAVPSPPIAAEPVEAKKQKAKQLVRKKTAQIAASGEKPCKQCKVVKPLDEFPRNPTYTDQHTNVCKECTRERVRARNASDPGVPDPEKTEDGKLICPLCNTPCSTKAKYQSHMYMVHDKEV